jgi:hypothetical protein
LFRCRVVNGAWGIVLALLKVSAEVFSFGFVSHHLREESCSLKLGKPNRRLYLSNIFIMLHSETLSVHLGCDQMGSHDPWVERKSRQIGKVCNLYRGLIETGI